MWAEPKIDVRIPYEPGGRLGEDYNRIMRESAHEWILFKDHDVIILHPNWYQLCQNSIRIHPDAGIFTIYSNNIGNKKQKHPSAPSVRRSLIDHKNFAHRLWLTNKYRCTVIDPDLIGGFFLLTSKSVWSRAGGFRGTGLLGEDNEYHQRVQKLGLKTYRIDGLYAFHMRDRVDGSWIPGVKTTTEYWRDFKKRHEKDSLHGHNR